MRESEEMPQAGKPRRTSGGNRKNKNPKQGNKPADMNTSTAFPDTLPATSHDVVPVSLHAAHASTTTLVPVT